MPPMKKLLQVFNSRNAPAQGTCLMLASFLTARTQRCLIILSLVILLSSCVNGPVRCHLNGRFNYLTAETARNYPWYTYPVTLPAAAVCDTGIMVADVIGVPLAASRFLPAELKGAYLDTPNPLAWLVIIPFIPVGCVKCVIGSSDSCKAPFGGVLYQGLFGYYYIDTAYSIIPSGRFKISCSKKTNGKTVIELDGQVVCEMDGRLDNLVLADKDNVVASLDDGTMHWRRHLNGQWQPISVRLIPGTSELIKAIEWYINVMKRRINDYEKSGHKQEIIRKHIKDFEKSIALSEVTRGLVENGCPVAVKKIYSPSYWDNHKITVELIMVCQSYVLDVFCHTNGNQSEFIVTNLKDELYVD